MHNLRMSQMIMANKLIKSLRRLATLDSSNMSPDALAMNATMQHNCYQELKSILGEARAKAIYDSIYGNNN